jgi:hypothetical protein
MIGYVINQIKKKVAVDRDTAIRFINQAAYEIYRQCDVAGIEMEAPFKINGDQTITCPWFVDSIRGVRELNSMQAWHLNKMRPRYYAFNWKDMWRNIRIKNKQALQATITNQSSITVTTAKAENPAIVVTIVGQTDSSSSIAETITLDSTSKTTINCFLDVNTIIKDRRNDYDIVLTDVDGKQLSVIPNHMLESVYQVIDVSSCPWLPQSCGSTDNYLEVLYKQALSYLSLDSDSFPTKVNYDNALVDKALQIYYEEQGKTEQATAFSQKVTLTLAAIARDLYRGTEDIIALSANPHDTIHRKIGPALSRRNSIYYGRRS